MENSSSTELQKKLHPVLSVILSRAKEKSKPGKRKDKYRVGLVIEGGAMKGVISAGMLVGLERLGFRDSFDAVYGTSIGAGNAAWFVANQLDTAITTYFEKVNNFSFINPLRVFKRRPIMSIDYVDKILDQEFPLDFEEIKRSGIKLGIMVTRVDKDLTQENPLLCLTEFKDKKDLIMALNAAVNLPFIAGKPYQYKGMMFWDGGLIERIPLEEATKDNCTHILVLLNRTQHTPKCGIIQKSIIASYLKKYCKEMIPFYLDSYERWRKNLELIEEKNENKSGSPYITRILPSYEFKAPSGLELRHKVLLKAAKEGVKVALKAFGMDRLKVQEELVIVNEKGKMVSPKLLP